MTKKLKKKIKKTVLTITGSLLSITALSAIGTSLLIMQKNNTQQISTLESNNNQELEAGEVEIIAGSNENIPITLTDTNIAEDGAILCNSIIQGARDNDLPDGEYTFRVTGKAGTTVETKDYAVELINFKDDVTYSLDEGQTAKTISLGDTTTKYKTLIVKYNGDLTVEKGVTVTATTVSNLTYKKGMYLCVLGDLKNYGTISMTARGTYNLAGENVYLWKNRDESYEYVPALGGTGGGSQTTSASNRVLNGKTGNAGTGRQTGGGGTGGRKKLVKNYHNRSRRKRNIILRRFRFWSCKF